MKILTLILTCVISFQAFTQVNLTQVGKLPYNDELNDIWGTVVNGTEYALVGVRTGFSVVDLSNPSNPTEVFSEAGATSTWRDIKTWNNHAYVTNESAGGLLIVDLSTLPGNANLFTKTYTGSSYPWTTAHNLYIDENGICYIFGANYNQGGVIILDLTQDPKNPVELGTWNQHYLHDGVARGDTLWGSAVLSGIQLAIDVTNKSNPTTMVNWATPHNFTHNCWFSDDGSHLFTTDEVSDAYVAAYDVSDFNNVTETDKIQSSPGQNVIPHNTHVLNDFLVTSYYTDGVQIVDAARPHNIIEVGNFDTSPSYSGNGFNGCWGAYPWLPSGLVLATDIEEGLYVLNPTYQRACYVEGTVSDSLCGGNIINAQIDIVGTGITTTTNLLGEFAFGTVQSGTYSIQISKTGYTTKTINNVNLANGQLTNLNVLLNSNGTGIQYSGTISSGGSPLANAKVHIQNSSYSSTSETDPQGQFADCNIAAGTYDISISKWGYQTVCLTNQTINASNNTLTQSLSFGYEDDFSNDLGWTVSSTASTGIWTRGEPDGTFDNNTPINPDNDASGDCLDKAFMTGNGGGGIGNDDIDGGTTTATSPAMDLSNYTDPYIDYASWFYASDQSGEGTDYYKVEISNGTTTATIENLGTTANNMSQWNNKSFRILDFISLSSNMQIIVEAGDVGQGDIVEAAIDNIIVFDSAGNNPGLPPVAAMTSSVNDLCIGGQANFTDNSSNNPTSWAWTFQGGTPSTSSVQNPTISYANPGTYDVTLVVSNANGSDTITSQALINVFAAPSANFTTSANQLTISFTDISSNAQSWVWDFGDGNSSSSQNPSHTYASAGNYTVCLTADNPGCASDSSCSSINVSAAGAAPQANFGTTNATSICEGQSITFIDQSLNTPSSWEWTFQGGSPATSNQQNPTITYANPGTYFVKLKAVNGVGSDSITQQGFVTVDAKPVGNFSYTINGQTVSFTDNSSNATSWLWGFGNGIFNTSQSPTHAYNSNGTYTVCLTVEGSNPNCPDDVYCQNVTIGPSSIEELHQENLQLYPNPVAHDLIVSGFVNNSTRAFTIYDMYGKAVFNKMMNPQNGQILVNITNLSAGSYVIQVDAFHSKIVKLE
ncbi:MAG: choice-of-anchor B family protein [Flavobacteriales bacterium]|nr:choice-of-anchor B family protein [Flavobacteriales bacterium]